ncbi:MAG TPA: glutamine ABC transporter substrate-binding protein [Oribacterium sp.]|jgi:polar amino acid transport system substrate-binding protein|nr:glutamine ABC transporter substrate-binding protein [Oribacterium sp.]
MMKKFFAVAMSALMAASMMTGCGSSAGSAAGTAQDTQAATTAAQTETSAAAKDSEATTAAETSAAGSAAAAVAGKTYKIAIDQAFAPFSIQQDDGSYKGIDVDMIQAIAEQEGFTVDIQPMDFSAIIPALVSGTIDGGLGCMSITDERKQTVDFSDPYYEDGLALVTKSDSSIAKLDDLNGKTVAVKEGTQGALWADDNKDKYSFTISTLPDSTSTAMAVKNGQADALLEDFPVISYQISIGEQEGLKVAVDAVNEKGGVGFSVNKGQNQELMAAFNEGLAAIKANGTYDKILASYEG